MRALVLVDGLHSAELLGALASLLALEQTDLDLVSVRGPAARARLDAVLHRAGHHALPPQRARELDEAEREQSAAALAEAVALARPIAASVRTFEAAGEPGRAVCELAARESVDMVAIRAGGPDLPRSGPPSLGPVARYVTDHAPCPVLLLRG